jgi:hypothetical protein
MEKNEESIKVIAVGDDTKIFMNGVEQIPNFIEFHYGKTQLNMNSLQL